jgi:hypothetical protein
MPKHSVSLAQGNSGFGHQEEQFKIGSKFDFTGSDSSEHVRKGLKVFCINNDSMTAVTNRLLNLNKCVPSSLQIGCGQAIGGLIIPRGGPADPRHNSPGSSSDSRYTLILGAGMLATQEQQAVASE